MARVGFRTISRSLIWALPLGGGLLAYEVLRQNGRILRRLEALERHSHGLEISGTRPPPGVEQGGLAAGMPAPDFSLSRLDGDVITLADFRGMPILLVFLDPSSEQCARLAQPLGVIARTKKSHLQVLVVSRGTPAANQHLFSGLEDTYPVVRQRHWEISRRYGTFHVPAGCLIDQHGILASCVVTDGQAILALAHRPQGNDV